MLTHPPFHLFTFSPFHLSQPAVFVLPNPQLLLRISRIAQFISLVFAGALRLAGEGEDIGGEAVFLLKLADQRVEFFAKLLELALGTRFVRGRAGWPTTCDDCLPRHCTR